MNEKIAKLQKDLQQEFITSFKSVKDPNTKQFYEDMVKLNAEMIAVALQKYEDEK